MKAWWTSIHNQIDPNESFINSHLWMKYLSCPVCHVLYIFMNIWKKYLYAHLKDSSNENVSKNTLKITSLYLKKKENVKHFKAFPGEERKCLVFRRSRAEIFSGLFDFWDSTFWLLSCTISACIKQHLSSGHASVCVFNVRKQLWTLKRLQLME